MNYEKIEIAIVELVKSILDSRGNQLITKVDFYNGEFDQDFTFDDYHPASSYCLVQVQGARRVDKTVTGSDRDVSTGASVILFVGDENTGKRVSKKKVYEMIHELQTKLNGQTLLLDTAPIGKLRWREDAMEFVRANHVCFSSAFDFFTLARM